MSSVPIGDVGNLRQIEAAFNLLKIKRERSALESGKVGALTIAAPSSPKWLTLANFALLVGMLSLVAPTLFQVARDTWTSEQGGHGPLVLATGLWAVWREIKTRKPNLQPGRMAVGLPPLCAALIVFILARVTGILEVEAFAVYGALICGAYLLWGPALLRAIWFPLVYLAFTLPPPDTLVAAITQPIKVAISSWAVSLLYALGYPIANAGVTIQIGQYELLVAAACAGLNSIITLTALCLFYVYLRHRSNFGAFLVIAVAALPIAIISNFVRVIALVLITYHFGDAAAQGFLHDFAGLFMFAIALLAIFGIDKVASPFFLRSRAGSE